MVSGFGGLLSFYIPDYATAGADYADITALMTYPSMFMGIGNIVSVPLALSIGRRPVFMASTILLIFSSVLCAFAKDYTWHFSARLVLGIATGQSEALVPLMVQVCSLRDSRSSIQLTGLPGNPLPPREESDVDAAVSHSNHPQCRPRPLRLPDCWGNNSSILVYFGCSTDRTAIHLVKLLRPGDKIRASS